LDKKTANYTFSGVDLKEVLNGNSSYLDAQLDSISKRFRPQEGRTGSYSTPLPGKMYLSGTYALGNELSVGALFFTEKFQGRVNPGGSASLSKHVGKWLSATLSYTVSNRSYNNLGMGFSVNLKPVQLYLVGDNLLRIPGSLITTQELNSYVNSTKLCNVRFGLNFVWGRNKDLGKLLRNSEPVGGKESSVKEKPTVGNPNYLKVREKYRVNRKPRN
jgi:hypothetical protein